jgi:hypothetical protein
MRLALLSRLIAAGINPAGVHINNPKAALWRQSVHIVPATRRPAPSRGKAGGGPNWPSHRHAFHNRIRAGGWYGRCYLWAAQHRARADRGHLYRRAAQAIKGQTET